MTSLSVFSTLYYYCSQITWELWHDLIDTSQDFWGLWSGEWVVAEALVGQCYKGVGVPHVLKVLLPPLHFSGWDHNIWVGGIDTKGCCWDGPLT